ncbi:MAG: tRNA pseudouridine(55) synthase TruB [Christensenellaceae bacterium]|nr:tRNA pseudouridine(55) synthase TruB [Christensenellaceae bacterium]
MNSGVISVLKPPGMSSGGVLGRIKFILGTKKVGHAGTLDPAAAGVLAVCVGRATRLSQYVMDHDKEYIAEIAFGCSTDTLDAEGKVTEKMECDVTEEELLSVLPGFTGEIEQYPPMYSAIKINGRKAYDLARKGIEVEMKPRIVNILSIEYLGKTEKNHFLLKISCSKGTYIRTLLFDIAEKLGYPAHTSVLIRSNCGGTPISEAYSIEEIEEMMQAGDMQFLKSSETVLMDLPEARLRADRKKAVINGLPSTASLENGMYRLYCGNEFCGVGLQKDGEMRLSIPLYE